MRRLRRAIACTLVCCAPLCVARAEEPSNEELGSLRLEDLMEIQVEAPSKQPLPLRDAPTVGAAIAREQIEAYGWTSANDVLFRQPGFAPSQDFERTTVSARGLHEGWNNNHLLMLVDGVPHNNNVNLTAYTWDITPLYMVETMEVTRGPGSALYGSTAMNGIVALHTINASNERPAAAQVRIGNDGRQIYDLMAAHVFTPFSFIVAYNHTESDGNQYQSYDASGRVDAFGRLEKFETNDKSSSDYVFAKVDGKGALTGLQLQLHYQYWKFGTGQGWLFDIPDQPEHMATNVQILSLSYKPRAFLNHRLSTEFLLMWQRQEVDYHARLYPNGTLNYPDGLTEVLDNETNDIFARAQATWRIWRELTVLGGVEDRLFLYTGDHNHEATADLSTGGSQLPFPGNQLMPLPPALQPIQNHPVDNVGIYAQIATGRMFHRILSATAGLRYDVESFSYEDLTSVTHATDSKTFQQFSPRVALLVHPWREQLVFKAMVERAFRAPAPSELFGANTYFITSNINRTEPEQLTVYTLAGDLAVLAHLDLRLDWYYQKNDNPIDFSMARPNFATNLVSDSITGIESEILWDAPLSSLDLLSGFFNYTWAHLVDETVIDTTLMKSKVLPWAPQHVFNVGMAFNGHGFGASLQCHYQGRVYRRPSDIYDPDGTVSPTAAYRPTSVAPWATLDARLSYRVTEWLRVGVQGTNITNTKGFYLKTERYPFDYQIEGARVMGTLEVALKLPFRAR